MEDSAISAEEQITWRLNVSTEKKKNLSKSNQEEMEEMVGTRST